MEVEEVDKLELDLRTNDDNRVMPIKQTSTLQLEPKEG